MTIHLSAWVNAGESGLTFYLKTPTQPDYPLFFSALIEFLSTQHRHKFIEIIPSYHSCLLAFDNRKLDKPTIKQIINAFISSYQPNKKHPPKLHQIPVCYDSEFALDLAAMADKNNLSIEQIIQTHCQHQYTVYSLGFIPGFAFLGYVDDKIAMPRHLTPRDCVSGGSVGIAGKQTGIYPKDSPGGWQIIGKTPTLLYAPEKNIFSIFHIGDQVQFYPIERDEFHRLQTEQNQLYGLSHEP